MADKHTLKNEAPDNKYYIKVYTSDKASQNGLQDVMETWHDPFRFSDISDDKTHVTFYFNKKYWNPGMADDIEGNGVNVVDTNVPGLGGNNLEEENQLKFSRDELTAIAREVGKAVAKAAIEFGGEINSAKIKDIYTSALSPTSPQLFTVHVIYKNDNEESYRFDIRGDSVYLIDQSYDREIADVGVKPSGEAVVNKDIVKNEMIKYFKSLNEMLPHKNIKPGSPEDHENQAYKRLTDDEREKLKKIMKMIGKNEGKPMGFGTGQGRSKTISKGRETRPDLKAKLAADEPHKGKYVMHKGVPHKFKDGKLVPLKKVAEDALGFSDIEKLGSKAASDIDISTRRDPNYTFGKRPGDDARLRYMYAKKLGYLKEEQPTAFDEGQDDLFTFGYNLDMIQAVVDHLKSNYSEDDYELHIGRGDTHPNAVTLKNPALQKDDDLIDMLYAAQGDEDSDVDVNENQPTVFDDESMDDLLQIILKYVKDPKDAEKELDMVDYGGLDAMSPELTAQLERDKDFKKWYDNLHSSPSADTDYMQRRREEDDYYDADQAQKDDEEDYERGYDDDGLPLGEADTSEIDVYGYQTKHFDICPGATKLFKDIMAGKYTDGVPSVKEQVKLAGLAKLHDVLFAIEKAALKDSEKAKQHLQKAINIASDIYELGAEIGLDSNHRGEDLYYIEDHIKTINDAAREVEEGEYKSDAQRKAIYATKAEKEKLSEIDASIADIIASAIASGAAGAGLYNITKLLADPNSGDITKDSLLNALKNMKNEELDENISNYPDFTDMSTFHNGKMYVDTEDMETGEQTTPGSIVVIKGKLYVVTEKEVGDNYLVSPFISDEVEEIVTEESELDKVLKAMELVKQQAPAMNKLDRNDPKRIAFIEKVKKLNIKKKELLDKEDDRVSSIGRNQELDVDEDADLYETKNNGKKQA